MADQHDDSQQDCAIAETVCAIVMGSAAYREWRKQGVVGRAEARDLLRDLIADVDRLRDVLDEEWQGKESELQILSPLNPPNAGADHRGQTPV
ncbi:hypothetical protein AYR46_20235 [Sphingobium yanoikuyae]|nr:hypothetical protein AYR46_20235 [Sphingobium yanoikuyae]